MEEKQEKTNWCEDINSQIETKFENIAKEGVNANNVEYLYKLVDIHKDLANETYWKEKVNMMYKNYGNYGNYGRDSYGRENYGRDSYGRESYGREYGRRSRDSRGRYTGEDILMGLEGAQRDYSESKELYTRGNYGAKEDAIKSLEYMLESVVEFMGMLKEDASSKEEMELIKKYSKQISEM